MKGEEGRLHPKDWKGKNSLLNKSKDMLTPGVTEEENECEIGKERESKLQRVEKRCTARS